jgi:hypothetical protein
VLRPRTSRSTTVRVGLLIVLLIAVCGVAISSPAHAATSRVVGSAATPNGSGWWTVDATGDVTPGGDAASYGDTAGRALNRPIVGMASTPDGRGYWLVASDGGIFSFGDAAFYGSTGSLRLNQPIVGMASTVDGRGYWLVASDGGIFSFGDASFHGSTGSAHLATPMVAMASTRDGGGYWMVTSGGQVYGFGGATVQGQPGASSVGIVATAGGGYTVLTVNGSEHYGPATSSASTSTPSTSTPSVSAPSTPSVSSPSTPSLSSGIASALQTVTPGVGSTGLASTDGTATEPQVVRDGSALREVDPASPSQYLPGDITFAGVDAYELNTDWSYNLGCGTDVSTSQIDTLFASIHRGAVVRVWWFQQFALNQWTGQRDWAAMDRLVADADQYGVHLIATLGNQDGTCDDGVWKGPSWYESGWKTLDKNWGDDTVSFQQWVRLVVSRYASNPAILAWEPMNEPRPDTCTLAPSALGWTCWNDVTCPSELEARDSVRDFFDQVGAEIRAIEPEALISDGALEEPGCGWTSEADWDYVESSPGIDLVSLHDYSGPVNQTAQALAWYLDEEKSIGKPVYSGENGDYSYDPTSCSNETAEMEGQTSKALTEIDDFGFVGWLWWNWDPSQAPTSASACAPGPDPLMTLIQQLN